MIAILLAALLTLPLLLPLCTLSSLFSFPPLISAILSSATVAILLQTPTPPPASIAASALSIAASLLLSLAHSRAAGRSRGAWLSGRTAAILCAPPAVLSIALCALGSLPAGLTSICVLGPVAAALAATRIWHCRPSVDTAAALQAELLASALRGSGVAAVHSRSGCGLAVCELRLEEAAAAAAAAGRGGAAPPPPLLLLPGYGSGSALFFQQAVALAKGHAGSVFFVDWWGCGSSLRPLWPAGSLTVEAAEDALLLPLEAWMEEKKIASAILVGHSLGGYLATALWLRRPARVAGLVLLSPAGWAGLPFGEPLPGPSRPAAAQAPDGGASSGSSGSSSPADTPRPARPRPPKCIMACVGRLWDGGFTPMAGLRGLGPFGFCCVRAALRGRASRWLLERPFSPETASTLGAWLFHQLCAPPSGEYVLPCLLAPGAWARSPLLPRLKEAVEGGGLSPHTPVHFLYGDYDWMSIAAGREAASFLCAKGWRHAVCEEVQRAGHHLYLEAPTAVNAAILVAAGAVGGGGGEAAK